MLAAAMRSRRVFSLWYGITCRSRCGSFRTVITAYCQVDVWFNVFITSRARFAKLQRSKWQHQISGENVRSCSSNFAPVGGERQLISTKNSKKEALGPE